jgi:hypothetical protein
VSPSMVYNGAAIVISGRPVIDQAAGTAANMTM